MKITATPTLSEKEDMNIDASSTTPPALPSNDEIPESASTLEDEEDQLDFEETLTRVGMDINMVYYLPTKFCAMDEEGEVAQLDFGPKNAIFEKPIEPRFCLTLSNGPSTSWRS